MGELLQEMEERGEKTKQGQGRPGKHSKHPRVSLKTMGLGFDEAARAKKLAESSEGAFEHAIATAKKAGELSDQIVIREATQTEPHVVHARHCLSCF